MGLKETTNTLARLLEECGKNLQKASGGNKAAAQRVRTTTIRMEKLAKVYRKESVAQEKKGAKRTSKAKPRPTKKKKKG